MGLMIVSFLGAFMSTVDTHLNLSSSYVVNDVYRRFVRRDASESLYVMVSRLSSVGFMIISAVIALNYGSISGLFKFLLAFSSGVGLVYILRWFWWRVNAWSEISAMIASLVYFLVVSRYVESNEHRLAIVAALTIPTWLLVTFLTRPEEDATLDAFYQRIRPGGGGWKPVAARKPGVDVDRHLPWSLLAALLATGVVYLTIPGVGMLLFGQYGRGVLALAGAVGCAVATYRLVRRIGWEKMTR